LCRGAGEVSMFEWAGALLREMDDCAGLLDQSAGDGHFRAAVAQQRRKLDNPALTPSARVLEDMRRDKLTFFRHSMGLAERHREAFLQRPLASEQQAAYVRMAEQSLSDQEAVEAEDQLSFEDYLANYYRQYQDCGCSASET